MNRTIYYENLAEVNRPFFRELQEASSRVIESGRYILGSSLEEFERAFADYNGASFCVGVACGLDALILSLRALDLPAGSEVIVPSNTYIATVLAVIRAGLTPVMAEPDRRAYNLDPREVEKNLTSKTAALLAVHLYGKPCDMDGITALCRREGLKLVEDCAQSHGAAYRGKKTGTFGDAGAFSFYPTKNLGSLGNGGAVLTDDEGLARELRTLRNYGFHEKNHSSSLGYNSKLDELQAAFLLVKLKYLDRINEHKRALAEVYFRELADTPLVLPARDDRAFDIFHIFNVLYHDRDGLKDRLQRCGVATEIHYPVPPHRQECMEDLFAGHEYPVSDHIHRRTLSLPISYSHTAEDIYEVTRCLKNCL